MSTQLSLVKQALIKIEELESKLKYYEAMHSEPIAIVGMGCRFPGDVNTPAAYWELLQAGISTVSEAPLTGRVRKTWPKRARGASGATVAGVSTEVEDGEEPQPHRSATPTQSSLCLISGNMTLEQTIL